jgi:hypothetical protein
MGAAMSSALIERLCAIVNRPDAGIEPVSGEMIALARRHRVHLLLAERAAVAELAQERRDAAALEALREAELRRVLAALSAQRALPVLFKGAAMARSHYRSPELRVRSDTDMLIPAGRREEAAGVLESLGYRRAVETDGELIAAQFHYACRDRAGVSHALDVHWRISNALTFADVLSYEDVAREAVAIPGLGTHALGPCAVHSLMLACLHRIAHHPDSNDLLWLYDLHLLVERLTRTEQQQFVQLAGERRVRSVCAYGLADAFNRFGGRSGDLAARLAPSAHGVEPTAAFTAPRRRPVDTLTADLRALDRWPQRLQLLREHVFPRREYMFARYGTRRSSSLPWLYMRRIVAGAPKWFRS